MKKGMSPRVSQGTNAVPTYQLLWAKIGSDGATHPLICHLIDVAQVAHVLWRSAIASSFRGQFAHALGLDSHDAGALIAFWVGLHDLGKASPAFQRLHEPARASLGDAGLAFSRVFVREPNRHGAISAHVLSDLLAEHAGLPRRWAKGVARAVGGHHGAWPTPQQLQNLTSRHVGDRDWDAVRLDLLREMMRIFDPPPVNPPATESEENALLTLLSGLASVSDWIGSMETYFPYAQPGIDTSSYAQLALQKARHALKDLGWLGWQPPSEAASFAELFLAPPWLMQEAVIELASRLDPPALVIIEAPTGAGKTEAALYLADRWARMGRQSGMYVAMPTMATSNAMFHRVRPILARRYPDSLVNLHLVHSHARSSKDVQTFQLETTEELEAAGDASHGTVAALSWFLPRKRTLLASFGVGTVDQALLSVLQTRHFFVRLCGLAHKTVIFDEVHAYDTYMSTLFQRLLEWLHAVGASVVILSATLPDKTRRDLLQAYTSLSDVSLPDVRHPSLTFAAGDQVGVVPIQETGSYVVKLEWIARDPEAITERVADALCEGGCAAVICNTVRRTQEVYQALKEAAIVPAHDLILFHGRFPFAWRNDIEQEVLARFGKGSDSPRTGIVVATQVVEQSLDLDFDLMVTDLAPVDLLIQRAGRLHRHERGPRPGPVSARYLVLCKPDETDGMPDFGPDVYIYDKYVLLRSYWMLQGREQLTLPEDTTRLIESLYDDSELPFEDLHGDWAQELVQARQQMDARQREHVWKAHSCLVPAPHDEHLLTTPNPMLDEDNPELHEAFRALTRLGRLSLDLVCLHRTDRGLILDPEGTGPLVNLEEEPDNELSAALAQHRVSVTHYEVVKHFLAQEVPKGWQKCPSVRYCRAAVFSNGVCRLANSSYVLRLTRELGLQIDKEAE